MAWYRHRRSRSRRAIYPPKWCPRCTRTWLCNYHYERFGRPDGWQRRDEAPPRPPPVRAAPPAPVWQPWWGLSGHLGPRGMGLLGASVAGVVLGSAIATQRVASHFGYHPNLGDPLVEFLGKPLYVPWAVAVWHARFGHTAPLAFSDAEQLGTVIGLVTAATIFMASYSRWMRWMSWRRWWL